MIGLNSIRYVSVWARKIPSKNIVFNPQYENIWIKAMSFWDYAQAFKGNKQNFKDLFNYLSHFKLIKKKAYNRHVAFVSKLPQKEVISMKEYERFIKDKTPVLVEKFSHPDSVNHLGSSRHLLLSDVQVKGCGRNMLVSRTDYVHSWGGMFEVEAIYSYLASNYLHYQLPFGSSPTFKIDQVNEDHFQIMRHTDGLRISQFSPAMNNDELDVFRKQLISYQSVYKTVFQLAYASFCNIYNYSLIAENMLIDGRVIDCESIYNPKSLEHFHFSLDLCIKGKSGPRIKKNDLKNWRRLSSFFKGQKESWLCNSSVHGPKFILNKYQKMYAQLFPQNAPVDLWDLYWQNMIQLFNISSEKMLDPKLVKSLKAFAALPAELGSLEKKDFSFHWEKQLAPMKKYLDPIKPFEVFFFSQEEHQTFLRVRFSFKRPAMKNLLLQRYNCRPRIDLLKEASIFIHQRRSENAISNASVLNHEINRAQVLVPFTLNEENKIIETSVSSKDIGPWLKTRFPQVKKENLRFRWLRLGENSEELWESGTYSEIPKKGPYILYEAEEGNFKFLTPALLVI